MFEMIERDGGIDVDVLGDPFFWDTATEEREARPVIETKFDIRKRI